MWWKFRASTVQILMKSIVTKFRTLHGSCVVLECANICSNFIARNGDTVKRNVYHVCLLVEKALMNWVPDYSHQSIKAILFTWYCMEHASHKYILRHIYFEGFIYNYPQINTWYHRTETVGFHYIVLITSCYFYMYHDIRILHLL